MPSIPEMKKISNKITAPKHQYPSHFFVTNLHIQDPDTCFGRPSFSNERQIQIQKKAILISQNDLA